MRFLVSLSWYSLNELDWEESLFELFFPTGWLNNISIQRILREDRSLILLWYVHSPSDLVCRMADPVIMVLDLNMKIPPLELLFKARKSLCIRISLRSYDHGLVHWTSHFPTPPNHFWLSVLPLKIVQWPSSPKNATIGSSTDFSLSCFDFSLIKIHEGRTALFCSEIKHLMFSRCHNFTVR